MDHAVDLVRSLVTSNLSMVPFELLIKDQLGTISSGTAFFAEVESDYFLVTALHNLTGMNFYENTLLKDDRRPTEIECVFLDSKQQNGEINFGRGHLTIPLYSSDYQSPCWVVSPNFGDLVDVAAIQLNKNIISHSKYNRPVKFSKFVPNNHSAGSRISVLGYTDQVRNQFNMPLWKQGFIATEPRVPLELSTLSRRFDREAYLPGFLLDMLGRHGLSGAPVFFEYEGPIHKPMEELQPILNLPSSPGTQQAPTITHTTIVGINTGRIFGGARDAPLCICWSANEIYEICVGKRRGTNPHN